MKRKIITSGLMVIFSLVLAIFLASCDLLPKREISSQEIDEILKDEVVPTIPDVEAEISYISEDTYLLTPGTEDISMSESGCAMYVNNTLILYPKIGTEKSVVEALAEQYNATIAGEISDLDIYQLKFETAMTDHELNQLIEAIEAEPSVDLVTLDHVIMSADSYIPNDKWYDNKSKNGSDPEHNQWRLQAIHAYEAWDYLDQMEAVNVAVVEGYVDEDHEDLKVEKVINPAGSITGLTSLLTKLDNNSHGVNVAGILAATADNGKGITGICAIPGTKLYACNTWINITVSHQMAAISELITKYDVKVINISQFTGSEVRIFAASHGNKDAIKETSEEAHEACGYLNRLLEKGYDFLICVAAGNQNSDVYYKCDAAQYDSKLHKIYGYVKKKSIITGKTPHSGADAKYAHYLSYISDSDVKSRIVVVGNMQQDKKGYSAYHKSNTGDRVDIMAPGTDVYSCANGNKYTCDIIGTSQACPHVAGVAAMVFACNSDLTGADVKQILCDTADYSTKYADVSAGLLQADAAVESALGLKPNGLDMQEYGTMTYEEIKNASWDSTFMTEVAGEYPEWSLKCELKDSSYTFCFADEIMENKRAFPYAVIVQDFTNGQMRLRITDNIHTGMTFSEVDLANGGYLETLSDGTCEIYLSDRCRAILFFDSSDENTAILTGAKMEFA